LSYLGYVLVPLYYFSWLLLFSPPPVSLASYFKPYIFMSHNKDKAEPFVEAALTHQNIFDGSPAIIQ